MKKTMKLSSVALVISLIIGLFPFGAVSAYDTPPDLSGLVKTDSVSFEPITYGLNNERILNYCNLANDNFVSSDIDCLGTWFLQRTVAGEADDGYVDFSASDDMTVAAYLYVLKSQMQYEKLCIQARQGGGSDWIDVPTVRSEISQNSDGDLQTVQYTALSLPAGTAQVRVAMGINASYADLWWFPLLAQVDFYQAGIEPGTDYSKAFGVGFEGWGADSFQHPNVDDFAGKPIGGDRITINNALTTGFSADRNALQRAFESTSLGYFTFKNVNALNLIDIGVISHTSVFGQEVIQIDAYANGSWVNVNISGARIQKRFDLENNGFVPIRYLIDNLPMGTTKVKVSFGLTSEDSATWWIPMLDYIDFYDYAPDVDFRGYVPAKHISFGDANDTSIVSTNNFNRYDVVTYRSDPYCLQRVNGNHSYVVINVKDNQRVVFNNMTWRDKLQYMRYYVEYSTDSGATWELLRTVTRDVDEDYVLGGSSAANVYLDVVTALNLPAGTDQLRYTIDNEYNDSDSWYPFFNSIDLYEPEIKLNKLNLNKAYDVEFNSLGDTNINGYSGNLQCLSSLSTARDGWALQRTDTDEAYVEIKVTDNMKLESGAIYALNTFEMSASAFTFKTSTGIGWQTLAAANYSVQLKEIRNDGYGLINIIVNSLPQGTTKLRVYINQPNLNYVPMVDYITAYNIISDDGAYDYTGYTKAHRVAMKSSSGINGAPIVSSSNVQINGSGFEFSGAGEGLQRMAAGDGEMIFAVEDDNLLEAAALIYAPYFDLAKFEFSALVNSGWILIPGAEIHKRVAYNAPTGFIVYIYTIDSLPEGATQVKMIMNDINDDPNMVWFPMVDYVDIYEPLEVSSSIYVMNDGMLSGLTVGQTVAQMLTGFTSNGGMLQVCDKNGVLMAGTDIAKTGAVLQFMDGTAVLNEFALLVYGDTNGDGAIAVSDLIAIKRHMVSIEALEGVYLAAAKVTGGGTVGGADISEIKKDILGIEPLAQ